jgi:hypothetical protein
VTQKLVVDELIEEARRATGLERFDSQSFRRVLGSSQATSIEMTVRMPLSNRFVSRWSKRWRTGFQRRHILSAVRRRHEKLAGGQSTG